MQFNNNGGAAGFGGTSQLSFGGGSFNAIINGMGGFQQQQSSEDEFMNSGLPVYMDSNESLNMSQNGNGHQYLAKN